MKRLIFSPGFPPSVGGSQNYMYARCVSAPVGIEVLASRAEGCEDFDMHQPFVIHRFDYPWKATKIGPLNRLMQIEVTSRILNRHLRLGDYDVLETSTVFPGALVAQQLKRRGEFLLVSFAYGDDVLRPLRTWYAKPFFRRVLKDIDFFVAISRYTKQILVDAGAPPERIAIIHPPIDREIYSQQGDGTHFRSSLPPHNLLMLTISRLVEKKGIDTIINLMPRLKHQFPGLLYVVGGIGDDISRLKMLAKQNGVSDSVFFLGAVPTGEMVNIYAAADIFVMPTRADPQHGDVEGFGIVFLEAGSQGVPAIGPRQGGCADAIMDGINGYLVDPYDNEEIESRIIELLGNPGLRQAFGEAARERALETSDWSPLLELKGVAGE